jgi:hypothetical protein
VIQGATATLDQRQRTCEADPHQCEPQGHEADDPGAGGGEGALFLGAAALMAGPEVFGLEGMLAGGVEAGASAGGGALAAGTVGDGAGAALGSEGVGAAVATEPAGVSVAAPAVSPAIAEAPSQLETIVAYAAAHDGGLTPAAVAAPPVTAAAAVGEPTALVAADAPTLPTYAAGSKTEGILQTASGDVPLQSGWSGPAQSIPPKTSGFDIVTRTHVEGHAAALMRTEGITDATLYINNPDICSSCSKLLERMLPTGTRLTVVTPNGSFPFIGK